MNKTFERVYCDSKIISFNQVKFSARLKHKLFAEIEAVPAILQGSYYPSLDGLRGVAILMVISAHFGLNHFLKPYRLLINSDTGVNIFFVLSGFLITTLLLKEKLKYGRISLKRFYMRRVLRILPAAYLFILVLIMLNLFFHLRIRGLDFITSALFLKNMPLKNEPYTAHFWSLAVEVQFYLVFPFLLAHNVNRYLMIALLIVILVPLIAIPGYYHAGFLYANPAISFITKVDMYSFWKGPVIILIGSVLSILLFKGVIVIRENKLNLLLSIAFIIAAVTISSRSFIFYSGYPSAYVSALLIAVAIPLSLTRNAWLSGVLINPALIRIGVISYSLYIWQELFIGTHAWQPWMMVFSGYPVGLLIIIKLLIVFVLAWSSWYFIELRFLKVKNRYK